MNLIFYREHLQHGLALLFSLLSIGQNVFSAPLQDNFDLNKTTVLRDSKRINVSFENTDGAHPLKNPDNNTFAENEDEHDSLVLNQRKLKSKLEEAKINQLLEKKSSDLIIQKLADLEAQRMVLGNKIIKNIENDGRNLKEIETLNQIRNTLDQKIKLAETEAQQTDSRLDNAIKIANDIQIEFSDNQKKISELKTRMHNIVKKALENPENLIRRMYEYRIMQYPKYKTLYEKERDILLDQLETRKLQEAKQTISK